MDYSITLGVTELMGLAVVLVFLPLLAAMIGYAKCENQAWANQISSDLAYKRVSGHLANALKNVEYYKQCIELLGEAHKRDLEREILKSKREHGKKVRKQADRILEKTERQYDARLTQQQITLNQWKHDAQRHAEAVVNARMELSMFQSIVTDTLESFVKLPAVRKKMLAGINQRHIDRQKELV